MSNIRLATLLPELGEATQATAQCWVDAALAHAAALREYDRLLYPHDPARQGTAESLHEAWRCWAVDAEVLLRQAESIAMTGGEITHLDSLRDMIGRTEAMLQLTPALIAQRRAQANRGEVFTLEEVRRELRGARVAGDARADLHALESWLQEELWDELELLLTDLSLLPPPSPDGDVAYEFARESAGFRHIVFMTLGRNDSTRTLTLLGVVQKRMIRS